MDVRSNEWFSLDAGAGCERQEIIHKMSLQLMSLLVKFCHTRLSKESNEFSNVFSHTNDQHTIINIPSTATKRC